MTLRGFLESQNTSTLLMAAQMPKLSGGVGAMCTVM